MSDRIGVLGGMGPYAGLDLVKKIFDETVATTDQEHLDVMLLSTPRVPDRTAFLLGKGGENPAAEILAGLATLEAGGARVVGMPCNTAHAPAILDEVRARLHAEASRLRFLSMIEETAHYLAELRPAPRRVGVMSTTGTMRARLYRTALEARGFQVLEPDETVQAELVQKAIYDPVHGIKAQSNPVTEKARNDVLAAIRHVAARGAEVVLLACTELPLAVTEKEFEGVPLVDPTRVLARALIRETCPEKLRGDPGTRAE